MKRKLESLLVPAGTRLRETINQLDRAGTGFLLVVDHTGKLTGVLTDGDLRRSLLRGLSLTSSIDSVARSDCVTLPYTASTEAINATLNSRITFVPLLDESGCPVDVAQQHVHHHIPLAQPYLAGNEEIYLMECVRTGWISSQGRFVGLFEKMLSEFHADTPALTVCNGTVALHLALETLGIGPGDEVVVPDFTFAATANAVIHAGASPVFVDVAPETWTMDPVAVERALTPHTKAIIPVHLYGHPCDMDPLLEIARSRDLAVIEDCAEALGARYKGRLVGTFGHAACFSFFGNKTVTTGEGGAVLLAREVDFNRAKMLRDHGMDSKKRYWHQLAGYNYRMTNLQAALGVAQMERVESILASKQALGRRYLDFLKQEKSLVMPPQALWAEPVNWLFTLLVSRESNLTPAEMITRLAQQGIETRPVFFPLHAMPAFKGCCGAGDFPVTEHLAATGLSLPSALTLSDLDVDTVAAALIATLDGKKHGIHGCIRA